MPPQKLPHSKDLRQSASIGRDTNADGIATPSRMLRKQVLRACDRCRARRVKCDNTRPCIQCHERGLSCTNSKGSDDPRSLPQALREIEKLRLRVSDLEAELAACRQSSIQNNSLPLPSPSETPYASPDDSRSSNYLARRRRQRHGRGWVGTHTASPRSDQTSYYGPSSGFYFLHRIGSYLAEALQQPPPQRHSYPQGIGATWKELTPLVMHSTGNAVKQTVAPDPKMPRLQEEQFIQLYWQLYHCTIPIIDDVDFMAHYSSLWDNGNVQRRPCPLADIIVALSMQHSWSFLSVASGPSTFQDPSVAGRWHFRRCQNLLAVDLETPSIVTVQCKMLSFVYLCNASFANSAHLMLSQASRMAQILGLHIEPPENLPRKSRELHKRVWCCLYTMEARLSLKLGRPSAIDSFYSTTTPPSEDAELGLLSSAGPSASGITWMTYAIQLRRLMEVVLEIQDSLQERVDHIFEQRNIECSLYEDSEAVELYARMVAEQLPSMQGWVTQLPKALQLQRKDDGGSYSTDRSALNMDLEAPLWLQRQRVSLELIYHSQMITLYRPCIVFPHSSSAIASSSLLKQNAAAALRHAITYSTHMHQAIMETDIMNGWQEFLTWQWNATITVVGFLLAHPVDAATPAAHKALDTGISIFKNFAESYTMASNAASALGDLKNKIALLSNRFMEGMETDLRGDGPAPTEGTTPLPSFGAAETYQMDGSEFLDQFMDWALTIDSYNSFEQFFDGTN
ncbi:hypothetical protein NLG97_g6539 [Lecanicillium saksenae]|uniref:Uncharacterized protein n=1 Tax=Lecanicillium saksenae TaxID=468837 RepID=A0ACC1QQG8_9HYPO|nr:hypothetical protein NLG97_g6539 [Lecanicillium saksenae]